MDIRRGNCCNKKYFNVKEKKKLENTVFDPTYKK